MLILCFSVWAMHYGIQVDSKDVVIPDNVCQMIGQLLQDINITPIPQVSTTNLDQILT